MAAPENTLSAVRKAFELGADEVEVDIRQTRDGSFVAIHDADVDRTTNGRGHVADLGLDELEKLDAGSWKGVEFGGERIPTLSEILRSVPSHGGILIEIKALSHPLDRSAEELCRLVENMERVSFQSFDPELLRVTRNVDPSRDYYRLIALWHPRVPAFIDHRLRIGDPIRSLCFPVKGVSMARQFMSARAVSSLRNRGLKVLAWTVNDQETLSRVYSLGCDGVITDDPTLLSRNEMGKR